MPAMQFAHSKHVMQDDAKVNLVLVFASKHCHIARIRMLLMPSGCPFGRFLPRLGPFSFLLERPFFFGFCHAFHASKASRNGPILRLEAFVQ